MANLIETAAHQKRLTTFVAALAKTPLVAMLRGSDPYTVFAPTDDAFDNLPAGTVNRLLEDPGKLTAILAYHIVPGRFTSADRERLADAVTTVEGSDLRVATKPHLSVNGARIARADVQADNGVIHVIDRLLLPLDDLGNVQVTYADVTVVEPELETLLIVEPASKSTKHAGGKDSDGKQAKGNRASKAK
jgi:uncharacterized surface protein with fasciclin (FAS1) repeats